MDYGMDVIIEELPHARQYGNTSWTEDQWVLMNVHAVFGLIAFVGTAPIGVFTARHMKNVWIPYRDSCYGTPIWSLIHITTQVLTIICTIISFIVVFVAIGDWYTTSHALLGIATLALCFLQPFLITLKSCVGDMGKRYLGWAHTWFGTVTFVVGVACVFKGMALERSYMPRWMSYIMTSYAVFFIVTDSLFRVIAQIQEMLIKAHQITTLDVEDPPLTKQKIMKWALLVIVCIGFTVALSVIAVIHPTD